MFVFVTYMVVGSLTILIVLNNIDKKNISEVYYWNEVNNITMNALYG